MKKNKVERLHIGAEISYGEVYVVHSHAFDDEGNKIAEFAGYVTGTNRFELEGFKAYESEQALLKGFSKMYKKYHREAEAVLSSNLQDAETCLKRMALKKIIGKKDIVPVHFGYRTM
ncbi:MAG: hypothetical protein AAB598_00515 [Patescibacteria group bacterium]